MCLLVSWTCCGDDQRVKAEAKPQGWKKSSRGDRIHSQTCWKYPGGAWGTRKKLCYQHLMLWICRTFWNICIKSQKELVGPIFDSSLWFNGIQIHEPVVISVCFTELSGESTDHFCYMAVNLNHQVKNGNSVKKLNLPSCPSYELQGTLCVSSSLSLDTYITIVMTCFLACLPKILRSSDRILFITVTPFPGTKEMATHVY